MPMNPQISQMAQIRQLNFSIMGNLADYQLFHESLLIYSFQKTAAERAMDFHRRFDDGICL